MRSWKVVLVCLAFSSISTGQMSSPANTATSGRLPVTRVVLYKNGVGYFEHSGHVRGNQDVNIDFTTAQLNDVLKSLTVLDLGKGRITGVSYNSTAPLERQLGALHLPVGENPSTEQFLNALRGARMEVRSGAATITGRLLSLDEQQLPSKGDEKITAYRLSIASDTGEVRVFDLNPSISVRVVEKDVNEQIRKYLGLVASTRDQGTRRMSISTAGDGERDLLVSYISEVPVWKCTYRLVLPRDGKALLQGWAVVDNTVGEDWTNVELSLVAGAPQSFVQELSQPYYARRPVVPLPENAQLTPQTHEATEETEEAASELRAPTVVPAKVQTMKDESAPPPSIAGVPRGVMGGVAGGIGSGYGAGIGEGSGGGAGGGSYKRWLDEDVRALESATRVAQTRDLGDLFEYKLRDRVTIRKNQSALVPILQARIDAERVSVWTPSENSALRALWVENNSGLTLDGGSFSVLEGNAFAGEGLMDPIKPAEKRLLSYAADLGVLVDAKEKSEKQKITKVVIAHGTMTQMTEEREERSYTVRNRDTSARTVVIEHPARDGWKLVESPTPAESSASFHRFRLDVDPKKTTTLTVKECRPVSKRFELTNVTDSEIEFFLSENQINAEIERALRQVVAQKNGIAALDAEIAAHKTRISGIGEDQQRVRENMKALKGSSEEKALIERYARELNTQEDQVQSLQHEMSDLRQKRDVAQKTLNEMIEGLQLAVTL